MRAMVFDHYGGPEVMNLRDVPIPEPQDGELLIRVGYAGVNPSVLESTFWPERTPASIRLWHGCRSWSQLIPKS
jgi:threonine dehydrogenase-like Zn-dependent dehydrogenase